MGGRFEPGARRALEIRTVVVGWRDVMADIRAGTIPSSRESIHAVTIRALSLLDSIQGNYADGEGEIVDELITEARAEVQGATFHDLADSGEAAG